jgi:glycosyltransferase involved in cell wall biosynthesis
MIGSPLAARGAVAIVAAMTARQITYLTYGEQSGVSTAVARALALRGHDVRVHDVTGPLEWRRDGRLRPARGALPHLLHATLRHGREALRHRWNTPYAFDAHSREAARIVAGSPRDALVLQNGALFSPPRDRPYVLLLDHTRALSMALGAMPAEGRDAPRDYGRAWRERERATYLGAQAVATFSSRVAASLRVDYGVPGERVHVVGAGATVLPERVRRAHDGRTITFVGRDFRRKGGPVLVAAFERVRRAVPEARLLVAGPREALSLPEGAVQLGPVPHARLEPLLAATSVFALPTLREPFGLALLDAMACGVPCVASAVEAVPEIVDEGVTGLLTPAGDADALARALVALLDQPTLAEAMGRAGRERVRARFTWGEVACRLERAAGLDRASGASRAL